MELQVYFAAIGQLATARSEAESATEGALIAVLGEHTRFIVAGADVGVNIARLRKMTTVYRTEDVVLSQTVPYCIRASVLARLSDLIKDLDPKIAQVGRIVHGLPILDSTGGPDDGEYLVAPAGGRDQSVRKLLSQGIPEYVRVEDVVRLADEISVIARELESIATGITARFPEVIRWNRNDGITTQ